MCTWCPQFMWRKWSPWAMLIPQNVHKNVHESRITMTKYYVVRNKSSKWVAKPTHPTAETISCSLNIPLVGFYTTLFNEEQKFTKLIRRRNFFHHDEIPSANFFFFLSFHHRFVCMSFVISCWIFNIALGCAVKHRHWLNNEDDSLRHLKIFISFLSTVFEHRLKCCKCIWIMGKNLLIQNACHDRNWCWVKE